MEVVESKHSDIGDLVDLWIRNFYYKGLNRNQLQRHLIWKYFPFFTRLCIARQDKKIIGTCGMIRHPIHTRDFATIQANWGIDSLVDKEVTLKNRAFVFFRVFRNAVLNDYRNDRVKKLVTFCFPNQVVRSTYLRIGWQSVPVFLRFDIDLANAFVRRKIVSFGKDAFYSFRAIPISNFKKQWDGIWKKISQDSTLVSERKHEYLNWRFFMCPTKKYYVFLFNDAKGIRGYAALSETKKQHGRQGHIVDIFFAPTDTKGLQEALRIALIFFMKRGVGYVHAYGSHPQLKRVLRNLGFNEKGSIDLFAFSRHRKLLNKLIEQKNGWWITASDGDFEMEI